MLKISKSNSKVLQPNDFLNGFSYSVPFINNIDIKNLLRLRRNDYESFLVYRDSIRNFINEIEKIDNSNRIDEVFRDIVNPEINKMSQTFKNNKTLLKEKVKVELLISSCLIGLGLVGGLVPPDIGKVAGLLGGCEFLKSIITQYVESSAEPKEIKGNKLYFIWKLKNSF